MNTELYLVTDRKGLSNEEFFFRIEEALKGGVTLLQLREKDEGGREFLEIAKKLRVIAHRYRVPLLINDRIDIAILSDADGVHLGQSDIPVSEARRLLGKDAIIGATAKTPEQAVEAYVQGADYIGCGAVFATATKADTWTIPTETIRAIVNAVPIPVTAIGGINRKNMSVLNGTGVSGICAVSALMQAVDAKNEAKALISAFRQLDGRK